MPSVFVIKDWKGFGFLQEIKWVLLVKVPFSCSKKALRPIEQFCNPLTSSSEPSLRCLLECVIQFANCTFYLANYAESSSWQDLAKAESSTTLLFRQLGGISSSHKRGEPWRSGFACSKGT
jgi:hypothetical protein